MKDEQYIFSLCDELLGVPAERQRSAGFLRGEGYCARTDAYYRSLKLVIEYQERRHAEPVVPKHGVTLVILSYSDFDHNPDTTLRRNTAKDRAVLFRKLYCWLPMVPNETRH